MSWWTSARVSTRSVQSRTCYTWLGVWLPLVKRDKKGWAWLPQLQYQVCHCINMMICYFDNCICHQNCKCDVAIRDDARLVPCGSHLWAMQPMWSTANFNCCATIEICPYKDPRHCTSLLVTLITLWFPIGLLWYQRLIA